MAGPRERGMEMVDDRIRVVQLFKIMKALKKSHEIILKELSNEYNLSGAQLDLLWIVSHRSGSTITELAKIALIHITTVVHLIKILENNGLVKRIQSLNDKREWHALITEKGKSIIENLIKTHDYERNMILLAAKKAAEKSGVELDQFINCGLMMANELHGEEFLNWVNQNVKQVSNKDAI